MKKILMIIAAVLMIYSAPASSAVFSLDPAHTTVGFTIEHLVISNVRGAFGSYEGEFEVGESNKMSGAKAVIKVESIDTKIEKRDNHLRSPDFFDTAKYPEMTFKSTSVKHIGAGKFTLVGELTLHGVTKEISLDGELRGPVKDPWGNKRFGIILSSTINRKDFGLTWNKAIETGGLVVGDIVNIQVEGEGILKK
jgi:polyisoprenoid-binding protein YceI